MSDHRYSVACLASPPVGIFAGDGNLTKNHEDWVQDPVRWLVVYYHNANYVSMGVWGTGVKPGDMAFFSPGTHGHHEKIGDETWCDFFGFELPGSKGIRVAVPHVVRGMEAILPNLRKASSRIVDTDLAAQAFLWNLLWSVSDSAGKFREVEALYVAEEFIAKNMGRRFSVGEVAEYAGVSPRGLLNLFRKQHGVTVQEFVLQKRIAEATRLLLTTDMPVKRVAMRVGFEDLHYFNKAMRSISGMSPREFRTSGVMKGVR